MMAMQKEETSYSNNGRMVTARDLVEAFQRGR
jgi:hypothetical protein